MKRKRFSEEQIVFARRQAEAGTPVGEVCRKILGAHGGGGSSPLLTGQTT